MSINWTFSKISYPKPYLLLSLLLLFLAAVYFCCMSYHFFPLDDPYIVLHNAQVLHAGVDYNYPNSPALTGATSAVHLLLVSLLLYIFSPIAAIKISLWIAIILYSFGLLRLAGFYQISPWQSAAFLVCGLCVAYTPFHLINGLETGLAMAAVTWLLIFALEKKLSYKFALLSGLAPFIRPELAILAGLLWLENLYSLLWHAAPEQKQIPAKQRASAWKAIDHKKFRKIAGALSLSLITFLPFVFWYWHSTGAFIPDTISAKQAYYAIVSCPLSLKLSSTFENLILFSRQFNSFAFLASILFLSTASVGRTSLCFLGCFIALYTYFLPLMLNVDFNMGRYWYPLVPILLYGVLLGFTIPGIRKLANIVLIICTCQALLHLPFVWQKYNFWQKINQSEFPQVSNWCKQQLPANAKILIHDAGYLAFSTHFQLHDMVGLKSPENIFYHQRLTQPSQGKRRVEALANIIKQQQPNFFVILRSWDKSFNIISNLPQYGITPKLLRRAPAASGYDIYQINQHLAQ